MKRLIVSSTLALILAGCGATTQQRLTETLARGAGATLRNSIAVVADQEIAKGQCGDRFIDGEVSMLCRFRDAAIVTGDAVSGAAGGLLQGVIQGEETVPEWRKAREEWIKQELGRDAEN